MREEQLTNYALGEVTDAEALEVEAYLAEYPDAAAFVEEVRADALMLTQALQAEPDLPAANESYRMQDYVMEPKQERKLNASVLAIAATVTLSVVGFLAMRGGEFQPTTVALNQAAPQPTAKDAQQQLDDYRQQAQMLRAAGDEAQAENVESFLGALESSRGRRDETAEVDGVTGPAPADVADSPSFADGGGGGLFGGGGGGGGGEARRSREPADAAPVPGLDVPESVAPFADELADSREPMPALEPARQQLDRRLRTPTPQEAQALAAAAPDDREDYAHIQSNDFFSVADAALSTFSVDVDTASYTNARRMLMAGQLPPADAVRVEEFVNYFDYGYAAPSLDDEHPFAAHLSVSQTPWNPATKLVRIGLKGKEIPAEQRPAMNLVFLLDVSGSMSDANKLPLVQTAMGKLAKTMRENDRVAIVVYAGAAGLVLDSTTDAEQVVSALQSLQAGGSTAGGAGIELAYATAQKHFIHDGVNRVILCTDGDFNVGTSDTGSLVRLVEDKAKAGVYLTVLGFGGGNLNDAMMEEISNKGEGNYAYIDSEKEAERLLVEGAGGTLQAIAKDVKIQVEFNPATVASYRLIGYENRKLADRDFNDDTKDAGDIGVGHTVTALYEIVPANVDPEVLAAQKNELQKQIDDIRDLMMRATFTPEGAAALEREVEMLEARIANLDKMLAEPMVDDLKYQEKPAVVKSAELLTVKLRYKQPDAAKEQGTSTLLEFPLANTDVAFAETDADFKQAASAAAFAMLLRNSEHAGTADFDWVIETSPNAELKELASKAKTLK